MKSLVTVIFLIALLIDPTKIGKINSLKSEAKKAYAAGDFKTAVQKYRYLHDSLQVQEEEVLLNLANAYFQLNDTANAASQYQALAQSPKSQLRSKAQLQLGVINNRQGKFDEALDQFKQSIKSDPTNADARYNYELLKKKLDEKRKKEEEQKNKNKNKSEQPSEFAKKLKQQADKLVAERQYNEAWQLMENGLRKDQTISHYSDYITRLKDVAEINKVK